MKKNIIVIDIQKNFIPGNIEIVNIPVYLRDKHI